MNAKIIGLVTGMLALATVSVASVTLAAEAAAVDRTALVQEDVKPTRSRQITGVITNVDREAKSVTIKARSGERTFNLAPRVQIKLGKAKSTLDELKPGTRVFIRYRDVDGQAMATTVRML